MKKQAQKKSKGNKNFIIVRIIGIICLLFVVGWILQKNKDALPTVSNELADIKDMVEVNGYWQISFKFLTGYPYRAENPENIQKGISKNQIPENIQALDNKKVSIQGFMLPIDVEQDKVKSLLLLSNRNGCCFGLFPSLNGMISVSMNEGSVTKYSKDIPVRIYGTLEVGEKVDDAGGASLYRMKADKVEVVDTLSSGKNSWF